MADPPVEDREERLKSALWFAIGKMVDKECLRWGRNATPHFIGALAELVWVQIESIAIDVESFSAHAGRSTVTTDDVLLLARKNEDLHDVIKNFIDQQKASKEATRPANA